jgi:2-hydroxy-3-oxopropionate reductase
MQVAVVGVGVMGTAIAGRLLDCGAKVTLFDTDPAKGAPLVERGASLAPSAAQAAAAADFAIVSLNSAAIVELAVFGPEGAAAGMRPGALLVDMSSIDAGRTAELARRLRETCGAGWVDAPLSGGAPAAAEGCLTLMVGGAEADFAAAEPLLRLLSANYTRFGEPGAGQTVKLINQLLCAAGFMAVAEAVRFAEAFGVDAAAIPAALAGGRADSRILQEFMGKMARRDYTPTGRIDNMLKDLETLQAAAQGRRVPLPVTSLVADLHRILVAGGLGPADSAEYVRLFDLAADR